jgi:hypothetical protein
MNRLIVRSTLALVVASATAGSQAHPKPDSAAKPPAGQRVPVPAYRNRIVGVFDGQTFQPVAGAEVSDVMVGTKSLTSSTGNVSLFFLPLGASLVRIRKVGYEAQTFMVSITPQDSSPISVVLNHVTELPTVVTTDSAAHYISPALKGFEERRRAHGGGYFITDSVLRKEEDRPLPDVIRTHVPGVNVVQLGPNSAVLISGRGPSTKAMIGGSKSCYPDVYLDGVALAPASASASASVAVNIGQFLTTELGAVEFYAGGATLPVQFNHTSSGCGALLLWTREK